MLPPVWTEHHRIANGSYFYMTHDRDTILLSFGMARWSEGPTCASTAPLATVIDGTTHMARDTHEKRARFRGAPAASVAGRVGQLWYEFRPRKNIQFMINKISQIHLKSMFPCVRPLFFVLSLTMLGGRRHYVGLMRFVIAALHSYR
jgi:hypothetical protein